MAAHLAIDPVSRQVHNAWLDWLRFLAALEVVLTHARIELFVDFAALEPASRTPAVMIWTAVTRLGYESVMIFFVLSGFLVGGRALELGLARKFNLASYAIDRLVRIQIPLTGAIALSCAVAWWAGWEFRFGTVLGNLFSLQGAFVEVLPVNFPLWSLSYEVWFYILGGATAFLLTRRTFDPLAALALVAAAIIFFRLNALYLLLWVGGALTYLRKPARPSWIQASAGLGVVALGVVAYQLSLPRNPDPAGHPSGLVLGGALILIGLAVALPNFYAHRWSAGRFAQLGTFLASFSYSLYLIHRPILELMPVKKLRSVDAGSFGQFIFAVLCSLAVAFLFSRCFETTGPKIKTWLRSRFPSAGSASQSARGRA